MSGEVSSFSTAQFRDCFVREHRTKTSRLTTHLAKVANRTGKRKELAMPRQLAVGYPPPPPRNKSTGALKFLPPRKIAVSFRRGEFNRVTCRFGLLSTRQFCEQLANRVSQSRPPIESGNTSATCHIYSHPWCKFLRHLLSALKCHNRR